VFIARSLAHKSGSSNIRAVSDAASEPMVERRALASQSQRQVVHTVMPRLDGTCALFCGEGHKSGTLGTITLYRVGGLEGSCPNSWKPFF
jgi:hypothetical protein